MMPLILNGFDNLLAQGNPFQGINDAFRGLEQVVEGIITGLIIAAIIMLVITIVFGIGFGTITGMVLKKTVSDELDEAEAGSPTGTSRVRGCLIILAGPFLGVGALLFTIFTAAIADDHGFDEKWFPVLMILGVVVGLVFTV